MQIQKRLAGKDAPLASTIDRLNRFFARLDLGVRTDTFLNPVTNCWSVHIRSDRCPTLYTNGKGGSKEACLASGLAEFYERLVSGFFFSEIFLDEEDYCPFLLYPAEHWFTPENPETWNDLETAGENERLLTPDLLEFYNRDGELLPFHLADCNQTGQRGMICALPFSPLGARSKQPVYFPTGLTSNLYLSNGLAAGNTLSEATAQALSEILERHVKNIVIGRGICLPDIPRACLENYPNLLSIVDTLTAHGFLVRVKDASLGGEFPVICVLLTDCDSGGVYCSFGANLRFQVAIERTLTELLQGRNLHMLGEFSNPCTDLDLVAEQSNLESHFINSDGLLHWSMFRDTGDYEFSPWDFTGSTEKEVEQLVRLLQARGYTPYRFARSVGGFHAVQILVPGMSEVYPTEDLIWNNRWSGTPFRSKLLRLNSLGSSELKQLQTELDDCQLDDSASIEECIGVVFDPDTEWYGTRLGEIRLFCSLALGDAFGAESSIQWCLNSGMVPSRRQRHYRLLEALLHLQKTGEDPVHYARQLRSVYSDDDIAMARRIISAETTFPWFETGQSWRQISARQTELLGLYAELRDLFLLGDQPA